MSGGSRLAMRRRGRILVGVAACLWIALVASVWSALLLSGAQTWAVTILLLSSAPLSIQLAVSMSKAALRLSLPALPVAKAESEFVSPPLAVPVILRRQSDVEAAVRCVEDNLRHVVRRPLCLLIDGPDSVMRRTRDDEVLFGALRRRLADRIGRGDVAILIRERRWDPVDRTWRGWERKRGKIEEFCRLLLGDTHTSFRGTLPQGLVGARAFVTTDIDTRLRSDTIDRLAAGVGASAAIAVPVIEDVRRAQPALFEHLQAPAWCRQPFRPLAGFNQTHLGHDLFYGKGLIVADRFLARTHGRIAERTILSHDHLEAVLADAVLVPEAIVREAVPPTRSQWARRQHRWMRGDFQIFPWLGDRRLSLVSRLHLLQIICAQASAPSSILSAIASTMLLPGTLATASASVCLLLIRPALLAMPIEAFSLLREKRWARRERWRRVGAAAVSEGSAWCLSMAFAAQDSVLSLHAGCIVAWRRLVTGRNLLQWGDCSMIRTERRLHVLSAAGGPILAASLMVSAGPPAFAAILLAMWLAVPLLLQLRPAGPAPVRTQIRWRKAAS